LRCSQSPKTPGMMENTPEPDGIQVLNYMGITLLLLLCLAGCERGDRLHPLSKEHLEGVVQKGPFLNGTSLNVAELNENLAQTGRNFTAQIKDNLGSFELENIELSTQFVELTADGFYFNEVENRASSARLILYALSNLSDKNTLNVNMLSHLEKDRIRSLVSQGFTFSDAKRQAQEEVLNIFSIEHSGMPESELLDISKQGEEHAILLAVSVILQGFRSEAELSELMANMVSDIRDDGVLDDSEVGAELVNHAAVLDLGKVRDNLEARFAETGLHVELPEFETHVEYFLENTGFDKTILIEYPEYSSYGLNILNSSVDSIVSNTGYSMAADLPRGVSLKIRLSGGLWGIRISPNGPVNWNLSEYAWDTESQEFTAIESGKPCNLLIQFDPYSPNDSTKRAHNILVEYYENLSALPTRTKTITVTPSPLAK